MDVLDSFLAWVRDEELSGQADADRTTAELGTVVRRIAEGVRSPDGRVLDIGSGTGAVSFAVLARGLRPVALDSDHAALARGRAVARRLDAPVSFVTADAAALPFGDATFGGSVHRSVLVYLEQRQRVVMEERRVLVPGGTVSCSESIGGEIDLHAEEPGIEAVWAGLREVLAHANRHAPSGSGLDRLYREAGFRDVRVQEEEKETVLDSATAVARSFAVAPPAGLSARDHWHRAGLPPELVDEFLARLVREAERARPVRLVTIEAYLTAIAP